ncbi:MAG: hypothetical protein KatS3mg110_2615 [Pirellulaceae bacterium]|nr:MAG: hypothetical protein KatS3mg110_2615 [Pirellulaceae bacterium]
MHSVGRSRTPVGHAPNRWKSPHPALLAIGFLTCTALATLPAVAQVADPGGPGLQKSPQDPPPINSASEADESANKAGDIDQTLIDTLLRLRRTFGNTWAESNLAADTTDQDFVEALRKVRASWSNASGTASTTPHPAAASSQPACSCSGLLPRNARVAQIRHIARQLEQCAADLEDLEVYADADDLRHLAARLRESVRLPDPASEEAAREAAVHALRATLRRE